MLLTAKRKGVLEVLELQSRMLFPGRWVAAAVLVAALLGVPGTALGQTGNFCVRDFQSGAVCTANDVRIQALNLLAIVETCDGGTPGFAQGDFEIFVSAVGAPERYDIGMFVALDGGSARDGNSCFHDYLQPPLTPTPTMGDNNGDGVPDVTGGPWLDADADACGDIAGGYAGLQDGANPARGLRGHQWQRHRGCLGLHELGQQCRDRLLQPGRCLSRDQREMRLRPPRPGNPDGHHCAPESRSEPGSDPLPDPSAGAGHPLLAADRSGRAPGRRKRRPSSGPGSQRLARGFPQVVQGPC